MSLTRKYCVARRCQAHELPVGPVNGASPLAERDFFGPSDELALLAKIADFWIIEIWRDPHALIAFLANLHRLCTMTV